MRVIANLLYTILEIIKYLIFARVILSYIPIQSNKFTEFIVKATEPCLGANQTFVGKVFKHFNDAGFFTLYCSYSNQFTSGIALREICIQKNNYYL